MSDDATPRLNLPYLAAAQAQKHVTLNEALARLDGLVHLVLQSRTLAAQPATPVDGGLWLLPAGRTGAAWALHPVGALLRHEAGGWTREPDPVGLIAWCVDEARLLFRGAAGWGPLADAVQPFDRLGVGATASAADPFVVRAAKALFVAPAVAEGGAGDLRLTLSKEAAADVASLLLQTGFSGRAELGLIGDDRMQLKVSADGSTWRTVFTTDAATGEADFAAPVLRRTVTVFTASGSYAVPAWARRITVTALGGGGGGASGPSASLASNRPGGGGGGAGGAAEETYARGEIGASLTVTVGAGGAGGASRTNANNGNAGAAGEASSVEDGAATLVSAPGGGGGAGNGTVAAAAAGWPGAAAQGGASSGAASGPGGVGWRSAGAGGGGGGLDTAGVQRAGGAGGAGYASGGTSRRGAPGTAGAVAGAGGPGGAKAWQRGAGGGGGGGGSGAVGAPGGTGGDGGAPGGGGGGGGATRETDASGAGGAGARGEVWIVAEG